MKNVRNTIIDKINKVEEEIEQLEKKLYKTTSNREQSKLSTKINQLMEYHWELEKQLRIF